MSAAKGVFPPTICSSQIPTTPINKNVEDMIENLWSVGGRVSNGSIKKSRSLSKNRMIGFNVF